MSGENVRIRDGREGRDGATGSGAAVCALASADRFGALALANGAAGANGSNDGALLAGRMRHSYPHWLRRKQPRLSQWHHSRNHSPCHSRPHAAFTLLELLIAVAVSVILVTILGFVFTVSINATRGMTGRVGATERMRNLNIRLRQEIGAMLPVARTQDSGDPANPGFGSNYFISPSGDELTFTTATDELGKPVTVDVRYKLEADPNNAGRRMLVRYRDATGPFDPNDPTKLNVDSAGVSRYKLGDYNFVTPFQRADILIANVLPAGFGFAAIHAPPPVDPASISPQTLPAAVRLTMTFSPEIGDPNLFQTATLIFPVYRGI